MKYIIYKEYNSDTIFTKTSKHQQLLSGSPAVSLGKLLASYGYTDLAHHLRNFGLITHNDGSFRVVHNERSPHTGPLNQFDFPKASDFFPVPHIKEIYCYYENLDTDEISHSAEVGSTKYNPTIRVSTSYTHNDMFATNTNIYIGDLLAPLLRTSRYLRLIFQQHKMRIGIIGRTELESSTRIMFPIHYDGDDNFTIYAALTGQGVHQTDGRPYLEFTIARRKNPISLHQTLDKDMIESLSNFEDCIEICEVLRVL